MSPRLRQAEPGAMAAAMRTSMRASFGVLHAVNLLVTLGCWLVLIPAPAYARDDGLARTPPMVRRIASVA